MVSRPSGDHTVADGFLSLLPFSVGPVETPVAFDSVRPEQLVASAAEPIME